MRFKASCVVLCDVVDRLWVGCEWVIVYMYVSIDILIIEDKNENKDKDLIGMLERKRVIDVLGVLIS